MKIAFEFSKHGDMGAFWKHALAFLQDDIKSKEKGYFICKKEISLVAIDVDHGEIDTSPDNNNNNIRS